MLCNGHCISSGHHQREARKGGVLLEEPLDSFSQRKMKEEILSKEYMERSDTKRHIEKRVN